MTKIGHTKTLFETFRTVVAETPTTAKNPSLDPAEQVALMLVVSAIFNLDEAVSKT